MNTAPQLPQDAQGFLVGEKIKPEDLPQDDSAVLHEISGGVGRLEKIASNILSAIRALSKPWRRNAAPANDSTAAMPAQADRWPFVSEGVGQAANDATVKSPVRPSMTPASAPEPDAAAPVAKASSGLSKARSREFTPPAINVEVSVPEGRKSRSTPLRNGLVALPGSAAKAHASATATASANARGGAPGAPGGPGAAGQDAAMGTSPKPAAPLTVEKVLAEVMQAGVSAVQPAPVRSNKTAAAVGGANARGKAVEVRERDKLGRFQSDKQGTERRTENGHDPVEKRLDAIKDAVSAGTEHAKHIAGAVGGVLSETGAIVDQAKHMDPTLAALSDGMAAMSPFVRIGSRVVGASLRVLKATSAAPIKLARASFRWATSGRSPKVSGQEKADALKEASPSTARPAGPQALEPHTGPVAEPTGRPALVSMFRGKPQMDPPGASRPGVLSAVTSSISRVLRMSARSGHEDAVTTHRLLKDIADKQSGGGGKGGGGGLLGKLLSGVLGFIPSMLGKLLGGAAGILGGGRAVAGGLVGLGAKALGSLFGGKGGAAGAPGAAGGSGGAGGKGIFQRIKDRFTTRSAEVPGAAAGGAVKPVGLLGRAGRAIGGADRAALGFGGRVLAPVAKAAGVVGGAASSVLSPIAKTAGSFLSPVAKMAGGLRGAAGGLLKRLPVIGPMLALAGLGSAYADKGSVDSRDVGGAAGGLAGGALGAAIGSFILPGVGTFIGGAIGGWLGQNAGEVIGDKIGPALADFLGMAKGFFSDAYNTISSGFGKLWDGIKDSPVFKWAGEKVDQAKQWAGEKATQVKQAAGKAVTGVSNTISDASAVVGTAVRSVVPEGVRQKIKDVTGVSESRKNRAIQTAMEFSGGKINGLDDLTQKQLIASTVATESNGGDYQAKERKTGGAVGAYQATPSWLADVGLIRGGGATVRAAMMRDGIDPSSKMATTRWMQSGGARAFLQDSSNWVEGMSLDRYMSDKTVQDTAFATAQNKTVERLQKEGLIDASTPPEKVAALLKAAHVGGMGGARAVARGGNGAADHNGTSAGTYASQILSDAGGYRAALEKLQKNGVDAVAAVAQGASPVTPGAMAAGTAERIGTEKGRGTAVPVPTVPGPSAPAPASANAQARVGTEKGRGTNPAQPSPVTPAAQGGSPVIPAATPVAAPAVASVSQLPPDKAAMVASLASLTGGGAAANALGVNAPGAPGDPATAIATIAPGLMASRAALTAFLRLAPSEATAASGATPAAIPSAISVNAQNSFSQQSRTSTGAITAPKASSAPRMPTVIVPPPMAVPDAPQAEPPAPVRLNSERQRPMEVRIKTPISQNLPDRTLANVVTGGIGA